MLREGQIPKLGKDAPHRAVDGQRQVIGLNAEGYVDQDAVKHSANHRAHKAAHRALHRLLGGEGGRQLVSPEKHSCKQGESVAGKSRHQRYCHQIDADLTLSFSRVKEDRK